MYRTALRLSHRKCQLSDERKASKARSNGSTLPLELIVRVNDGYSLMRVFDPDWNGSVPTPFFLPGRNSDLEVSGDVDMLSLRRRFCESARRRLRRSEGLLELGQPIACSGLFELRIQYRNRGNWKCQGSGSLSPVPPSSRRWSRRRPWTKLSLRILKRVATGQNQSRSIHARNGKAERRSFQAKFIQLNLRPNRVREEVVIQGMSQIDAFDGKTGWRVSPFEGRKDPICSPRRHEGLMTDADMDGQLVDYRNKDHRAELEGHDSVEAPIVTKSNSL